MADISDDEDDMDSSVDLLIRFLQATFKKVSKRAKKASRSILPAAISPKLVSFAVDGILLLASLSILKALLEVVCSIGGTVFVLILLLRFIWAAISYFQSSGNSFNQGGSSFAAT
ncbi:protein SHORT HYPOCOTYL IN WHITE LIGHT 1 [Citrus sinensis]|nr:protein SHORT HYPOCOTYL IN WHITE LIGHT 1 [Citrus sinensis]